MRSALAGRQIPALLGDILGLRAELGDGTLGKVVVFLDAGSHLFRVFAEEPAPDRPPKRKSRQG
ncbi:hypothetical protein [Thiocapsa sp. UBA6158]|uniref:hypothetical protein n=1 Tax=Thiocapsa sp. UBA6158 TaxID=1947692 RepID=UPI0025FACAFF|nr:hypothetical protein [Thiocapsa sp. UBA6158]